MTESKGALENSKRNSLTYTFQSDQTPQGEISSHEFPTGLRAGEGKILLQELSKPCSQITPQIQQASHLQGNSLILDCWVLTFQCQRLASILKGGEEGGMRGIPSIAALFCSGSGFTEEVPRGPQSHQQGWEKSSPAGRVITPTEGHL